MSSSGKTSYYPDVIITVPGCNTGIITPFCPVLIKKTSTPQKQDESLDIHNHLFCCTQIHKCIWIHDPYNGRNRQSILTYISRDVGSHVLTCLP